MKSNGQIKAIADGIYAEAMAGVESVAEVRKASIEGFKVANVDDLLKFMSDLCSDVEAVIKAPVVNGVSLPNFLSRVVSVGESTDSFIVSVRTKLTSPYKYRKDTEVQVSPTMVQDIANAYTAALFEMFYIEQAMENVDALNEVITQLLQENEIPYGFKFVVDHTSSADILTITDDEVVFNANVEKAMNISTIGIMRDEETSFNAMLKQDAVEAFVSQVSAVQTTPQLLKGNVTVISELTGLPTRKKVSKLIRKSYHRQAKFLNAVKTGVGYFDETVKVGKDEVDVFALVEKAEDGSLSVVLKPFNVDDQTVVKYDVLKEVKKLLK